MLDNYQAQGCTQSLTSLYDKEFNKIFKSFFPIFRDTDSNFTQVAKHSPLAELDFFISKSFSINFKLLPSHLPFTGSQITRSAETKSRGTISNMTNTTINIMKNKRNLVDQLEILFAFIEYAVAPWALWCLEVWWWWILLYLFLHLLHNYRGNHTNVPALMTPFRKIQLII